MWLVENWGLLWPFRGRVRQYFGGVRVRYVPRWGTPEAIIYRDLPTLGLVSDYDQ